MFSPCMITGRLDCKLCSAWVLFTTANRYLSKHMCRPIYTGMRTDLSLPWAPAAARMYKKWPHIPFLLSQPQYGTDTREDWTVSQHTQPLRSPITLSHLVRHTHKHARIMSATAGFAMRLITYPLIVVISVLSRSINITGLTVSLQNSGKSKHKHMEYCFPRVTVSKSEVSR